MNLHEANREEPKQATLESWKEIAAYLQRDAKTARRWEKEEGLPIHRHNHNTRSSVYAYSGEIDAWRASRKAAPVETAPARSLWRLPAFALTALLTLIMVGNGIRPEAASAQQGRPVTKRLLCADCGGGDFGPSFSPNGRLMVFTDKESGDIAIRDMSSGKVKRLLVKPEKDLMTYAGSPVISPDLRQIAYGWGSSGPEHGDHVDLRLVSNEPRSKPRVLIAGSPADRENFYEYVPAAWFPDGKSILAIRIRENQSPPTEQLARVAVTDGAVKVLKDLEWRLTGSPSISPDGRYIVYAALAKNPSKPTPAPTDPKDRHIYVLAADGSSEAEIVKASGINQNPAWTPDGKHILFTSDRSGKFDLWSIAMQNGKAAGTESFVSSDIGDVTALGMYGGSYYITYQQLHDVEHIHIVETAPAGTAQGSGVRETESFAGLAPTWSPDGKSIAFKKHHPGSTEDYDLVVRSLETGEERTYLTPIGTTGGGPPMLSHDGLSMVTGIKRSDGSWRYYRIGVKSGDFKALPTARVRSALSLDDQSLYIFRGSQDGKTPNSIVSLELSTGQERTISVSPIKPPGTWDVSTRGLSRFTMALSPDGRKFALVDFLGVDRMAADGSDLRELYTRTDGRRSEGRVAWSRDGRSIFFDQIQPDGAVGVMRVADEGGSPASLVFEDRRMQSQSFDANPDGSRFAFSTSDKVDGIWALDNVLSALK